MSHSGDQASQLPGHHSATNSCPSAQPQGPQWARRHGHPGASADTSGDLHCHRGAKSEASCFCKVGLRVPVSVLQKEEPVWVGHASPSLGAGVQGRRMTLVKEHHRLLPRFCNSSGARAADTAQPWRIWNSHPGAGGGDINETLCPPCLPAALLLPTPVCKALFQQKTRDTE